MANEPGFRDREDRIAAGLLGGLGLGALIGSAIATVFAGALVTTIEDPIVIGAVLGGGFGLVIGIFLAVRGSSGSRP